MFKHDILFIFREHQSNLVKYFFYVDIYFLEIDVDETMSVCVGNDGNDQNSL